MEAEPRGTVNTRTGKTVGAVKKSDGNALGGGGIRKELRQAEEGNRQELRQAR
ncbi:MAG: hypothetical protein ACLTBV_18100 [Enterocloster bolteae]